LSSTAVLVASLTERPSADGLSRLSERVSILEVRADLVGEIDADWLRKHFQGELLFTLRSRAEGGRSDLSLERRHQRLIQAASHFDLVDLEGDRDLDPDILACYAPSRRVISWHGGPSLLGELQAVFARHSGEEARYYKLIPEARQAGQEIAALALLHSLHRDDVIAFASGAIGTWTRLIAPRLGAPVVFGSASELAAAPGQLSIQQLIEDYGLPELGEVHQLFGIVGAHVAGSLSPRLHNHAYRRLGIDGLYLPFDVEAFGDYWLEVVESGSLDELGFELKGLSVTSPFKRVAVAVAGAVSPLAEWSGSANTLFLEEEIWQADSTDGVGVCGRAAAAALSAEGAAVTIVNRGSERGRKAAADLRLPFCELEHFEPSGFECLVNATSLGRDPGDELPFEPIRLERDAVVVDLVYLRSGPTRLVSEVRASGRLAIDGREVLLYQAIPQFRLMTGREMPEAESRRLLGLEAGD
jgi:3-dehydroquinate dehydratase/shikimate dehydrogenase